MLPPFNAATNQTLQIITSAVCKLLERMIRKQCVKLPEKHKMMSNKQFGFRKEGLK